MMLYRPEEKLGQTNFGESNRSYAEGSGNIVVIVIKLLLYSLAGLFLTIYFHEGVSF